MIKFKHLLSLSLLFLSDLLFAQGAEMADGLRSSGKIYVVVLVMSIIFVGVAVYLFLLDRRISKLEKQRKEEKDNV